MTRGRRARSSDWFLILGEDENDRLSLKYLCEGLCPSVRGRVKTLAKPVPKLRDASGVDLLERAKDIAAAVAAEAVDKRVTCVLVHEDLDAVGHNNYRDAQGKIQQALEQAFAEFSLDAHVAAIVAVEETEGWLLLFPDVLHGFRKGWVVPARLRDIDTSLHRDPKRTLKELSRKSRRPYRERDAPLIAEKAAAGGCSTTGANPSWTDFRRVVEECCA